MFVCEFVYAHKHTHPSIPTAIIFSKLFYLLQWLLQKPQTEKYWGSIKVIERYSWGNIWIKK